MKFPEALFWLLFSGTLIFFAFNILRRGGVKAAFFDARIAETLGEVEASGPKLVSQKLKVHRLDREGKLLVGVEIVSKTIASYQMSALVLSRDQAQQLALLLQRAGQ